MNKKINILAIIISGWFLFLCLLHYFSKRPLWLDELAILKNIQDTSALSIFAPLTKSHVQAFPRVYLSIIKAISGYFNFDVLSLRLLPLLFMLGGYLLWAKLYKKEGSSGFFFLLLLGSFAASHFTTYYAAELKQYSCDLFAAALYSLFIYCQAGYLKKKATVKRLWIFSLLSSPVIFFSYTSLLFAVIVIYNYFLMSIKDRGSRLPFAAYSLMLAICGLLLYLIDLRFSLGEQHLRHYWKDYFIDTSSVYGFLKSFTEGLRNLIVRWFLEFKFYKSIATIFMPFCLVAIIKYSYDSIKKFKGLILDLNGICGFLLIELFILGCLKAYPFTGARVTLFIAPFIFYMIVRGIYLTRKIKFFFYPLCTGYALFLAAVSRQLLLDYLKLYSP